jgi:hypothetical protein
MIGKEGGEVKNFNPNKQISVDIVLDLLLKHKAAMYKSEYGQNFEDKEDIDDNTRIENQASSLREMISSQKLIIDLIARPIIEENCIEKWNKRNKTTEEKQENPFDKEENDLKEILRWREFLNGCSNDLKQADLTKAKEDDFMVTKINSLGEEEKHLTSNFLEMRDDLAESYNGIYRLLIKHEIVTQKEREDEEITYKEQEELFLNRVIEA